MSTQQKQEPANGDIMAKLELIEKQIKRVDNRTRDIMYWLWGVLFGVALGVFLP